MMRATRTIIREASGNVGLVPVNDGREPRAKFFKSVLGGVDFGAVSPTALVVAGLDGAGRIWAVDGFYQHECGMDMLIEAMAELQRRWGIKRWIADPSGKEQIRKLKTAGFNVYPASHGNKIPVRVQLMRARLAVRAGGPGLYIDPSLVWLVNEIEGLMWKRVKLQGRTEEELRDEFDPSAPDHGYDALCNILADWDLGRPDPMKAPSRPITVYDDWFRGGAVNGG